jgi:DNA adenine methylase
MGHRAIFGATMSVEIIQGEELAMPIKTLVPWFGNKRTLAPLIVAELGKHRSYFEPFCGGLAVLLAKPESSHENVNDLHGDLINLARVVQDPTMGSKFYRRMRRVWLSEEQFLEARETIIAGECPANVNFERACAFFFVGWFGRNGVLGTKSCNFGFCARWTPNGGHSGKRFQSAVQSIPAWRQRMRRLTILKRDAFEMLADIQDCAGTVIYCDPPYLVKGASYLHDFKLADHQRLADAVAKFKTARVVVSYYDHPLLSDLYPGWAQVKINVTKALAHCQNREKNDTKAVEVLLINGPSFTTQGDKLFA